MQKLLKLVFGYRRFSVSQKDCARLLELLMRHNVVTHSSRFTKDGLFFCVSFAATKKLRRLCDDAGIALCEASSHGLPSLFLRYRRRVGLFVGCVLSAGLVAAASSVIFCVRVDGNERLSDKEVIAELRECGLHLGRLRWRVDTDTIENRVMIRSDDISWISINIIGTVAEVQIRESEVFEEPGVIYDAANVVAAKDGFIERFEDTRGNVVAEVGEFVRKGELIISGLYDSVTEGMRYTFAKGRVMARTQDRILVKIPFEYEKKVYTGRGFTEKYLIFFEKELKFFRNCGNLPHTCDTIETVEYLNFLKAGDLPLGVRTVRSSEYIYERAVRTENEAKELALSQLEQMLSERAEAVELIGKKTYFEVNESGITLFCEIEAIEDIAEIREIIIS